MCCFPVSTAQSSNWIGKVFQIMVIEWGITKVFSTSFSKQNKIARSVIHLLWKSNWLGGKHFRVINWILCLQQVFTVYYTRQCSALQWNRSFNPVWASVTGFSPTVHASQLRLFIILLEKLLRLSRFAKHYTSFNRDEEFTLRENKEKVVTPCLLFGFLPLPRCQLNDLAPQYITVLSLETHTII